MMITKTSVMKIFLIKNCTIGKTLNEVINDVSMYFHIFVS